MRSTASSAGPVRSILSYFAGPSSLDQLRQDVQKHRSDIAGLSSVHRELIAVKKKQDAFEELVRSVVDTNPDMLWVKDLGKDGNGVDARFIFTNKAQRDFLQCQTLEESLGKPISYFGAKIRGTGSVFTFYDACTLSDLTTLEMNVNATPNRYAICKFFETGEIDGVTKHIHIRKIPLFSGKEIVGIVGYAQDVTKRHEDLIKLGKSLQENITGHTPACSLNNPGCSNTMEMIGDYIRDSYNTDSECIVIEK